MLSCLWCKHCRNIEYYFSSFIYPVPTMMWPQIHSWGPNWSKTCCIFKWPSQIKVNSVPRFVEQKHKIWSNFPYAVGKEHNISYFSEIISFWFYWLLTSDESPLPQKSELLCSMDKHKFSTPNFPKTIRWMIVFQQSNNDTSCSNI